MTRQPRLILTALVLAVHGSLLQALSAALPTPLPASTVSPQLPGMRSPPVVLRVIPPAPSATSAALPPTQAVRSTTKTIPVQAADAVHAQHTQHIQHTPVLIPTEAPVHGPVASASGSPPVADAMPAPAPASRPASAPVARTTAHTRPVTFDPDKLPASVKLLYRVSSSKFPLPLHGELLWIRSEHSYQARLSFGALGQSRVQTSRGQIGEEGLLPERFGDKYRSELAAHFNRERGIVTFSANTPDAALPDGAQDRLSVLVQLAAMVASAPDRYGPGTSLTLPTVGPRDADSWTFVFGAAETLDLPGGSQPAIKLVRSPRQTYDQTVEIWLVPALGYLPGRIRITESNGESLDQQWVSSEAPLSP